MRSSLVTLVLLAACTGEPPPAAPAASIDIEDPNACIACHEAVVTEWSQSQHSRAHPDKDPVFAGMRALRMKKQGEAVAGKCAGCHTPRDPGQESPEIAIHGVSCATCHNLQGVEPGKRGAAALVRGPEGQLRGPHDMSPAAVITHGVGDAAPWLADGSTVCLACHGEMANPAGAITCNTGPEHEASSSEQSCADCHMPVVNAKSGSLATNPTHRSHAFLGPHSGWPDDPAFLATGVETTMVLDGSNLELNLKNTSAHGFPTGFPGRMVLVRAEGFDAAGERVWTNHQGDPMTQDPQSVLNKVYVDAEGAPTLPPFAESLKRDSRLKPDETRTLTWTVPEGVASAKATLAYRMVPPPAVKALGIEGHPDATTRPFKTVSASAAPRP